MRVWWLAGWVLCVCCANAGAREFVTESPPFRVDLLSLHRRHDLVLVRGAWIWVDDDGTQHPFAGRPPRGGKSGGTECYARLRIATDPPTFFRQEGPPRLTEAVDELDQQLEPFEEPGGHVPSRGVSPRSAYTARDVRLALSLPEQPGKTIKRLKGTIPVVLTARSADPVATLDLSRAKGRRLSLADARISVADVRVAGDGAASIKVVVALDAEKGDFRDKEYQSRVAARLVDVVQRQLDLVDDQSRPVPCYPTSSVRRNEARATLLVRPGDGHGAPDRLRAWELTRSVQEVPFEFEDVPLP